jgi:GNAT superfamily N-acetyltransferase
MTNTTLYYREALPQDILAIQQVRNAVQENKLSNPGLITDTMVAEFMFERGKGWVCMDGEQLAGFAIADLVKENIWALFLDPAYQGRGIGKRLQQLMLDWYFAQGKSTVWLGTEPGTRAAGFYGQTGWTPAGMHGSGEIKFEMTATQWATRNKIEK